MNLKKIREEHHIRLSELVNLSGVPRATLESIERRKNCQVNTAIKIADAIGISLDELCRS